MSITIKDKGNGQVNIDMDNGHVQALRKITKDYNLLGDEQAMLFMLALLSQANGSPVEINGGKFVPPDSFKKSV